MREVSGQAGARRCALLSHPPPTPPPPHTHPNTRAGAPRPGGHRHCVGPGAAGRVCVAPTQGPRAPPGMGVWSRLDRARRCHHRHCKHLLVSASVDGLACSVDGWEGWGAPGRATPSRSRTHAQAHARTHARTYTHTHTHSPPPPPLQRHDQRQAPGRMDLCHLLCGAGADHRRLSW